MDEELLMQNFCLISGIAADEAAQWKPLVLSCWEELKGKLRQSVEVEKHQQRLALACAALANHRFQTIQGTVCAGVKVGDISFTQSDGAQARSMRALDVMPAIADHDGVRAVGLAQACQCVLDHLHLGGNLTIHGCAGDEREEF